MIGITVIGSGSKGNSSLLELGSKYFLLDVGLSCKKIVDFLKSRSLTPQNISGIFLTHEHTDHISGLRVLLKKHPITVYATKGTHDAIAQKGIAITNQQIICNNETLHIGESQCIPFEIPHDAAEPVGYRFENSNRTFVLATDIGQVTDIILDNAKKADILCLESNYDNEMLQTCMYPRWLKNRIKSNTGHLPNTGVRGILSKIKKSPEFIVLMHLSQESNTPSLVRKNINDFISNSGNKFSNTRIHIASQSEPGPRLFIKSSITTTLKNKLIKKVEKTYPEILSA